MLSLSNTKFLYYINVKICLQIGYYSNIMESKNSFF